MNDPNRMSFLEHLEELRSRLWKSLIALVVGVLIAWFLSRAILDWLTQPLVDAYSTLSVIRPAEAFINRMKAAVLGGIFVASPVVFYQFWAFVSPGLYRRERRYTLPFLFFSILFFLFGAVFCYWIAMPLAVGFLAEQGAGYDQNVTLDSAFSFASRLLLALGLLFELPILIFFLSQIGVVTPAFLVRHFKYAVLAIFILAAIITPTPDVITQTVFALPMIVLYWIGIGVAWFADRTRRRRKDE